MKRGDWICPRCNFMNFERNVKCLECEEPRPKRQLTGGEWECPQCDFFNNGRNMVCLRCDCKRPGEASFNTSISTTALGYGKETTVNRGEIDRRLAANDEKAERWFNKVSQLGSGADLSTAIADEDFPEIMPLRKGVNRFVMSTRKTPLERRLTNAQYKRNLGNDGMLEANRFQSEGPNENIDTKVNRSLDEILGRRSAISRSESSSLDENGQKEGSSSASQLGSQLFGRTNGSSSNYDSFEGRSLTSPPYKRRMAMEQASKTNFVPFVPFPPDYFAKKDKQLDKTESRVEASGETLFTAKSQDLDKDKIGIPDTGQVPHIESKHSSSRRWTSGSPEDSSNESGTAANAAPVTGNLNSSSVLSDNKDTSSIEHARKENVNGTSWTGNSTQPSANRGFRETWMGKSLVGSAVKKPDPLDMSEEAKAERWFRRVAQIKDISKLSQIPDEDFPSIMPMRKGEQVRREQEVDTTGKKIDFCSVPKKSSNCELGSREKRK